MPQNRSALLGSYRLSINHGYCQGVQFGIIFTSFFILFLNLLNNERITLERDQNQTEVWLPDIMNVLNVTNGNMVMSTWLTTWLCLVHFTTKKIPKNWEVREEKKRFIFLKIPKPSGKLNEMMEMKNM